MEKVLRKEVLLSKNEYEILEKYFLGKSDCFYIDKKVVIKDGESTKGFNVIIKNTLNKEVVVIITNCFKGGDSFYFNYKNINELMSIKRITYFSLEDCFSLLIKIKEEYSEEKYSSKYDYNIKSLTRLKENDRMEDRETYSFEIEFADFINETELAFASYCFLLSNSIIPEILESIDVETLEPADYNNLRFVANELEKLYFSKLSYIDYELEDFYNPSLSYSKEDVNNKLLTIKSSSDLLRYLIGYIAYLRLSTDSNEERKNIELIRELADNIMIRYIWNAK